MWRFLAGALASLLLVTGAFLVWQSRAEGGPQLPPPPPTGSAPSSILAPAARSAPEATPKSREEKRFNRADKNKDGKIVLDELLQPRKKPFAKLDRNGDGRLSFEEWATSTVEKFKGADADRNGQLTRAEYASTAPKPRPKPRCGC